MEIFLYTFVIVGCNRDLALLEFQAQSIKKYLTTPQDILLIVNEPDPTSFLNKLNKFKDCYEKHNLSIKTLDDFDYRPLRNYDNQQVLKLAASKITDKHLLILDCQNFLFRPYIELPVFDDKIPYRRASYSMNPNIWFQYCEKLEKQLPINLHNMCLSTPMYLHSSVIRNMLDSFGGLDAFSKWFNTATNSKSEFVLYLQWCERFHGLEHFHYLESDFYNWAGPYLRDDPLFSKKFDNYLDQLLERIRYPGVPKSNIVLRDYKPKCCWTSINHRAWGDMSDAQFEKLSKLLKEVKLDTSCIIEYRKNYIHIPI